MPPNGRILCYIEQNLNNHNKVLKIAAINGTAKHHDAIMRLCINPS